MSLLEILSLALAGAVAGAVNALAGGGTLLTFPTLLFFNTSSVVANATSTLALLIGTSGSVYGFRRHLDKVKPWLWRFLPASLLGGLAGSILLSFTQEKLFSQLVPFLILFATVLFTAQGIIKKLLGLDGSSQHQPKPHSVWAAILFQFVVSVYGGFFGAGIGILMLATLGFLGMKDVHEMNTIKTILSSVINAVAAVWFIAAGLIHWPKMGVMASGALVGYYFGSHFSQKISQKRVRQMITTIGFVISAAIFYREFLAR